MKSIELEAMPELPEVLTRDVSLEESRSSLNLQTLFSYCVQWVEDVLNDMNIDEWKDGHHIIETYLDPDTGNQPIKALDQPELIAQLANCLDTWLIQRGDSYSQCQFDAPLGFE